MKNKFSIIICVYNEEETIKNVVTKCRKFNPLCEIVVVDDGSDDKTAEILLKLEPKLRFIYIRLPQNKGKSNAMVVGVENSSYETILFFDADVSGIKKGHFKQLLKPIFKGNADMVLGTPSDTLIDYKINPFKSLTGERALLKNDIVPILEDIRHIRFGVETYINLYFQAHGKKIKYTLLKGLKHPTKYDKTTAVQATKEFLSEGKEIAVTLLQNHDLISKRINESFKEKSKKMKNSIKDLQEEINEKIQVLLKNNG